MLHSCTFGPSGDTNETATAEPDECDVDEWDEGEGEEEDNLEHDPTVEVEEKKDPTLQLNL